MTTKRLVAASFLGGFAVMVLELAAVRILAPWFGDSAYVWTNAIGVLLAAMALGAWVGGRLSASNGPQRLSVLLLVAGGWTAITPFLVRPLSSGLLPETMALEGAGLTLTLGSLAATTILFALPVLLAAAASPVLVTAIVEGGATVGRAAGVVATASTLGSLVGTFGATHFLIPGVGTRATVWIAAGAVLVAGALVRGQKAAGASAVVPLILALIPLGPLRPAAGDFELLAERESELQFLQVQRLGDSGQVQLKINEGLDSFHSVRVDSERWTDGLYYDYHAVAPFLAFDGEPGRPPKVLSLGSAAGTFGVIFRSAFPGAQITSVEIDSAVVELGREFFRAYPEGEGEVFAGLDARVFVDRSEGQWDLVLVDAYERQVYLPAHVVSREFFSSVHDRLRVGGVVSVNVGGRSFRDPVLQAVGRTMREVFGSAVALRVPRSRNYVVVARRELALDPGVLRGVLRDRPQALRSVLNAARDSETWVSIETDGEVLTDDRPFLDELQDSVYRRRGEAVGKTEFGGSLEPGVALEAAQRAYGLRRFQQAIAEAKRSRRETPDLRLLVGNARFEIGDTDGGHADYHAARDLTEDPAMLARIDGGLVFFEQLFDQRVAGADSRARSTGTFAGSCVVLLGLSLLLARRC
ncbi:MAG: fused MFS/spermidine synthase [Planctomycetota bacterium]